MSRIGKQPVKVPKGVNVSITDRHVKVEGPVGSLEHTFPAEVSIAMDGDTITIERSGNSKQQRAYHGMTRALINNMVQGAAKPFEKILEIHGTGYSAVVDGSELELDIGFSNKIKVAIPSGLKVDPQKGRPVVVKINGADKQAVGQLAAIIRSKRPPSPYGDNKGIRYRGETIRKKAGKAFGDK